ncbi:MAG TPA: rhodanese-like domain-containing protein [Verrucomicrobiae bacterium]|jgi:rhodanese-related sulfurtransferase/thioredoxin-related protein
MKRKFLAAAIVAFGVGFIATEGCAQSEKVELAWTTDLAAAQVQAKAEHKSVLLFFHGSDWCPPCIEMQRQVINSPAFAQYARRALVLVDVDFPQKTKQTEELQWTNLHLKTRFNLSAQFDEGFPTLVLLNSSGETVFQETGYDGGGTAEILPELQRHTDAPATVADSPGFKNLDVDQFARMMENKQNVILDVRTPTEFANGHIAGALNLDVNAADFQEKVASFDKNKIYLVHCASGIRSVKACQKMTKLDFPNLYNLTGGFKAWAKAGKPVEK